jgi:hypothetical protein
VKKVAPEVKFRPIWSHWLRTKEDQEQCDQVGREFATRTIFKTFAQNWHKERTFLFFQTTLSFRQHAHLCIAKALRFFTLCLHNMFQPWTGPSFYFIGARFEWFFRLYRLTFTTFSGDSTDLKQGIGEFGCFWGVDGSTVGLVGGVALENLEIEEVKQQISTPAWFLFSNGKAGILVFEWQSWNSCFRMTSWNSPLIQQSIQGIY